MRVALILLACLVCAGATTSGQRQGKPVVETQVSADSGTNWTRCVRTKRRLRLQDCRDVDWRAR